VSWGFRLWGCATEKGRGDHFTHKILIVLAAMTSYIALAFRQGLDNTGEDTYFAYARFIDWAVKGLIIVRGPYLNSKFYLQTKTFFEWTRRDSNS